MSPFEGNFLTRKSSVAVKQYYIKIERYDWVDVATHLKGIESFFHRNRRRVILKLVKKYGYGSRFLDVGCGTGLIFRELPSNSVGLDINPWAARMAKKYAPDAVLVIGDAESLPFKDEAFSIIICTETIEHLPNPKKALQEIHRTIQPEGRLFGSVPHKSFLWNFRFLSSTCPKEEPFHHQFNKKQVQRLLVDFKILKIQLSILRLNVVFIVKKESRNKISKLR